MTPDDPMGRLFIGVALTAEARAAIAAHLGPASPLPGRPAPPENWHITLRFLGTTTTLQYERLLANLSELPASFRLRLGSLGAFPHARRANVLWLGVVDAADELEGLAAIAEEAALSSGFGPEDRPFHPHITLARVRPPLDLRGLIDSVPPIGVRMPVDSVAVFRSHNEGDGARYEVIESSVLG